MALYGSSEWLDLFKETINADQEFQAAAARFSASMTIATSIKGLPKPFYVWMDFHRGKMREWAYMARTSDKKSDFVFNSDYYTWKAICRGEMDVIRAVVSGKIKLSGNRLKMLAQTKASLALLKVMEKLDTSFPDEIFRRQ
ncbi:MAG: hypothetical protein GX364_08575 [Firmicutes bacterium]|jgi:hypothetical protein|nr:hypothetical protein [Bacillota bacterium]